MHFCRSIRWSYIVATLWAVGFSAHALANVSIGLAGIYGGIGILSPPTQNPMLLRALRSQVLLEEHCSGTLLDMPKSEDKNRFVLTAKHCIFEYDSSALATYSVNVYASQIYALTPRQREDVYTWTAFLRQSPTPILPGCGQNAPSARIRRIFSPRDTARYYRAPLRGIPPATDIAIVELDHALCGEAVPVAHTTDFRQLRADRYDLVAAGYGSTIRARDGEFLDRGLRYFSARSYALELPEVAALYPLLLRRAQTQATRQRESPADRESRLNSYALTWQQLQTRAREGMHLLGPGIAGNSLRSSICIGDSGSGLMAIKGNSVAVVGVASGGTKLDLRHQDCVDLMVYANPPASVERFLHDPTTELMTTFLPSM